MYGLNVAHQLSWKAAASEAVDDLAASQWMHTVSHTHTHTRVAAAEGDGLEFTLYSFFKNINFLAKYGWFMLRMQYFVNRLEIMEVVFINSLQKN